MSNANGIDWAAHERAIGLNWYDLDVDLQARVRRDCDPGDVAWAEETLSGFGGLVGTRVARNSEVVDAHPPELVRYDVWADDVSEIVHHPATLDSKRALWDAGYPSGFAGDEARRGRPTPGVVLGASSYLLSQADTGLVCSLGMTSGVAGLVDRYAPADVRGPLLAGLRSSDADSAVDGSMFLTERDGGSDLGHTVHCVAREIGDGRVTITGEKWFASNADGAAVVLLARPEGATDGSAGLGLYLVPRHLEDGTRNHYVIRRLKQKLGTRSVPTGEITFDGAVAYALRPQSSGASTDAGGLGRMMEMVNGSRFGVALMGLGIARRCFVEAAIWAHRRRAKGRVLVDLPLVREQLVDVLVELEGAVALGFECAAADRSFDDGTRLRRILVPAAKNRLCRLGVETASYAVEIYGGNGYCEDWGLTRQLRDAQCHPIWEGTENICALDVLRAMRQVAAHEAVQARVAAALSVARGGPSFLAPVCDRIADAAAELDARSQRVLAADPDVAEALSWKLSTRLDRVVSAALLAEQAGEGGPLAHHKALVARRYAFRHLTPEASWADSSAAVAGRELLAFADVSPSLAAKAAA
jgi:alkylation response protein AidB-like acyl-CoA dehydrogenase